jgi:hypothetical protein
VRSTWTGPVIQRRLTPLSIPREAFVERAADRQISSAPTSNATDG